jgi:nicotinate-nucleotide adenylyltransferase
VRVGILGGTFNPIHLGHLRAAEEIGEDLDLKKIYLIPAGIPPHKTPDPLADFSHRLEMVRLASATSPLLEVWDIEGKRPGLSYSIETLRLFHSTFGPQLELFFIVGIDAFLEIQTWKKYPELFKYASFVVINRAGYDTQGFAGFLDSLQVEFAWNPEGRCFCHPSGTILLQKETTAMDISASRIRQMVAEGKSIRFLVPEAVREYIERFGLYLAHESTR